ncbi:multidrug MFS transporter [Flavihumibacter solisilvae]|uniref:Multidrug MFS transporter n=2 Tax=Flavihumibacter solisilvae TaxID=1349421 RepID=A0A0C1IQQ3_9BACT|nr:multidrug MFS transporter [Flavihumibacter solisilvae]
MAFVMALAGLAAFILPGVVQAQQVSLALQASIGFALADSTDHVSPPENIRPFKVKFSDGELDNLRQRILATRWPKSETVADASQGVQLATIQKLAKYWAKEYNWRKAEDKLNSYPNFITSIDGLDIHFIHVRSKHPNALPLIVTHGWPGSVVELLKIIDPLTNPTAYGGKPEDAFHLVIPSLPGYGFSGQPTEGGWEPERIAKAWITLMNRLGYKRYVAQGGDWGDAVTEKMGVLAPPELQAIHTNLPSVVPDEILGALFTHQPAPASLSADEKKAWDQIDFFFKKGLSYAQQMASRPQTMYGIEDSPIGLASWILDHDARSYELIARTFDDKKEGLTKDDILDNITLYWLTKTAVSSARLYWENKVVFFKPMGVKIPVAVSAFPDELFQAPRSWTEKAYPKLIHYNRLDKGGHFAAWEQPELFTKEIRAAFKSVR